MNRFSVLYTNAGQYNDVVCSAHSEAETIIEQLLSMRTKVPIGVYDDKTELFQWASYPQNQDKLNQMTPEEQDKMNYKMIEITQNLRKQHEKQALSEEQVQTDVLQRPVFIP